MPPTPPSPRKFTVAIDFLSLLVSDELQRRGDRLLERRLKQARFRDPEKTIDSFDLTFNPKMNKALIFELATRIVRING